MSAVPKTFITPEEYLRRERLATFKSEYFNGEMFAMAGASPVHVRINNNIVVSLGNAFGDGPCYTLSADMRVKIPATGLYTYPDTIVLCEEPVTEDTDVLLNPKIIFEVLSPTTEHYDRGKKFEHYQSIGSLCEYILVAQDRASVEQYIREDDTYWKMRRYRSVDESLEFASIPARVPLGEIYRAIAFPAVPTLFDDLRDLNDD